MKFRPSARTATAFGALAIGVSALSGCTYINPVQTHNFYQSAEGSVENFFPEGSSSPVGIRNFLVVEKDGTKTLTGSVSNQTAKDYTVDVTFTKGVNGTLSVNVPAGQVVQIGGEEVPALKVTGEAKPGDDLVANITVNGETKKLTIQELDSSLSYLNK